MAETHLKSSEAQPPIAPEDYQTLRRVAFADFERQVLAAGGDAVRGLQFKESGSPAPQFRLSAISLSGEIVKCSGGG